MKSPEEWQELFDQIEKGAKSIILSPAALATLKDPSIKIEISISYSQSVRNAKATKLAKNTFGIVLYADLVAWLFETSLKTVHECPLIFFTLKRDEPTLKNAAYMLFKIWISFVIFHEWSHIIRGHLSFSKSKPVWFEFTPENEKPHELTNDEVVCLEADADAFATKFMAELHTIGWRILSHELYGSYRPASITYDLVIAIALLFEAFESISPSAAGTSQHPTVAQRMSIFNTHFFSLCPTIELTIMI